MFHSSVDTMSQRYHISNQASLDTWALMPDMGRWIGVRDKLGRNRVGCTKSRVIKCFQILLNGARRVSRANRLRIPVSLRCRVLAVGIGCDNTCISSILLATRQSCLDALSDYRFKHMSQHITVTKAAVVVL